MAENRISPEALSDAMLALMWERFQRWWEANGVPGEDRKVYYNAFLAGFMLAVDVIGPLTATQKTTR